MITAKKLQKRLGFGIDLSKTDSTKTTYSLERFRVTITDGREDYPLVSIVDNTQEGYTTEFIFPGAYRMKDLTDIMYFYLGENGYSELSKNWKVRIVKEKSPVSEVLKACGMNPDDFTSEERAKLLNKFREAAEALKIGH